MNLRSLQENVVETIEAFDNVAQVIEEKTGAEEGSIKETIRPIHYGDILRRLEFSGGDISVAQLTVYKERKSGDPIPSTPVGGDVDLITGALNPPTGWSFIPYGSGEIWASTSIWNSGVNQTGWSVPYLTSGVSGVAGEDGKDGIGLVSIEQTTESTGEGEVNVITATMSDGQVSTFRIRNGSAGETGPIGPAGPAGPQGPSGKDGADGKDGVDGTDGVDGKDGADGMDGSVYEYIYFRGFTANDKPFTPMGGNNTDDYVPADTKTVTINGNQVVLVWSDKAQGVDEIYKFEWQSERKKENATTWGNFSDPILWAKYGEKGKDGDGVQYIFTRTTQTAPENPTPSDWETSPAYQNNEADEYIPDGWTDDPEDVDETNKYCWVSVRKYRNSKWGQYSKPTLWTKWVESSGTVTADVVMIDMDPDWVMLNEDENTVSTVITAFRGDDPVIIKDVTADNGDYTFNAESNDGGKTWNVTVSNIAAKSSTTAIKINVKLSETSTRTKTFTIYHTQFDKETVSVDFGDDNVLIPCADGQNPDEGFFDNFEIPVLMRVGGELVTVTSITPDNYTNCFNMTAEGNLKVNSFPGTGQQASVKFTVSDGTNSGVGYVNFTKFNTQGGTLAMYTLNIDANDIVCDTRKNTNDYKVYAGKKGKSDNIIKASVNKYSSKEGNSIISVSDLPGNYAVFYANDPEDWKEDATSTIGEYQKITNAGIEIGKTINPDKCVSFQLREWIGEGEAWSNMIESNYKVWDTENILVDIIRDIASYQFVITPNKIHVDVEGNVVLPKDKKITIGLTKNVAGDGVAEYVPLTKCPAGYDLYYEIDNNGDAVKFGGEEEDDNLPYTLELDNIKNSVVLTMVVDENSDDSGMVVLSETVEITSDIPGKSAYVGYLTDSMCTVSCDANGVPTAAQVYETTFKVTNGTVQNVTLPQGNGYKLTHEGNGKIKIDSFTQALSEVTKLKFTATYVDSEGITGEEEAGYTIVKLKIAEASTILDFSNDNVIIPCDENGQPYISEASTFVAMLHGDDVLNLTSTDVTLGDRDKQGYYKISFNVNNLVFNGEDVCNKELTFTGKDATGESWTRKGQLIFTKMKAGESGQIWDLVLTTNSPKYNNDTDSFDDDYVEGWVNIWGAEDWKIASYNTLSSAGRYIVAKPNEDNASYVPLTANDFVNDRFRIYINTLENNEGKTFIDVDTPSGIKIALAKLENGVYVPIQEETMRASYDGRDFGKFELVLSDTTIHQTYKDGEQVTVTPNEISIVGVYEYEGVVRHDYKGGKTHNKYVSGLDIYYCIDSEEIYTEYNSSMTEVPDKSNDGWYTNDIILTSVGTVKNRLDVYLVAEYDDPDVEGNTTVKKVVDHKALLVVPIDLPNSSYHMELDQDELKVPIDEKGTVDPEFTATVTPYLYMDDDLQSITFEYAFGSDEQPKSGWADNKSFSASDFAGNHTYIWFRPKDKEVYKKCKITKELNPVEIFIDKQIVKRELSTGLVNDSITLEIKHWNYVNNTWDSVAGSVIMKYKTTTSNSESSYNISPSDGKYIVNLNNNTFVDINYIRFEVTANGKTSFEEVGVITDGRDGSSKEVIYYKSIGDSDVPFNPTPKSYTSGLYQSNELPSGWFGTQDEYTALGDKKMSKDIANKWVDEYPGVDETTILVYACERKKDPLTGVWDKFSEPRVYARYAKDGTDGAPSWSWRLSDPIEMVSFKSDGTANGTINSTTKALASCGGNEVTNVSLSIKNADGCIVSCNGDTLTLTGVPTGTETNNFTVVLKATGTYGNYTDTAELKYTVKKWFGEPSTVQVHLNNADTPVPTDSNGNYPEDVVRTATLTASSGTSVVNITKVESQVSGVTATLTDSSLKVTVPTNVTGWSNDVLTVPIVCTLADGYPPQTVSMSFYKVRAAKDAEYPDVYDLLVTPSSLLVSVDQETGKAKYPTMSIIPCILQYSANGAEKGLTVEQFNELNVGTISYNFDGETDSGGSVKFTQLTQNSIYVSNNKNTWDADEYIDIRLNVGNRVQTERVTISHDPIPNIDWELELDCPQDIWYKSDGTTKITDCDRVSCKIYRVVNGVKTYASSNNEFFGFDIHCYLDTKKQDHYTPGTDIELTQFNKSCKFVLVNPGDTSTNDDVVWDTKEVIKHYQEAGTPGDKGDDSIVTQLTNPSGTIMVVNGEFQSTTSESNLRALKGTEFGNITGVKITEITVNGTPVANDYVSVKHTDDITDPYTEEKLLFTINSSKVDKTKEQTIEATIQFTAFGKTFTEVKTILVRLAAENSCYLMLTDSNVSVNEDKAILSWKNQGNLTNTLSAVLYDGKTIAQGVEYSATFDPDKVKGSCDKSTGLISITAANPDCDTIEIPVIAKYRGGTYTVTLRVSIDVAEWKLKTNLLMINPDHPTDIVCSCLWNGKPIFGDFDVSAGWYRYKIDNGDWAPGENITKNTFTISKDVAKTVTNQMTIEWHSFVINSDMFLLDSQTIGILKDGVSGESAVHLELTQDSYNISLSKDSHTNISQAVLYYGSTALTSGVTYTSSRASATSEKVTIDRSGNITLDKSTITSTDSTPVNVTITATYDQKPYTKTFTLTKNAWDIWLSIDNVVINADDPKAITGRVMQNSSVFTKSNYYKLYYTLNGTGSEQSITSTDGTFTISLDTVKKATSSLEIYLRDSKGNLYDKESIGVVKNGTDGVNAQYYQIDANHILITKDSKGNVISPSEAITPKVCYINGAAKEDQNYNSLINEGYYIWKKLNGATATRISNSTSLSTACSLVDTQLVYYLCKKTVISNPETQFEDYVEIDVIQAEPGEKGDTGSNGPVIYPAGEWTSGTYTGNIQKAPYVSVTDGTNISYYIAYGSLSDKPSSTNTLASNVALDWTKPTNQWVKMENYNAIYADIGVLKEALVGQWVFHGNYMFSQDGTNASIVAPGTGASIGSWDEEAKYTEFNDPANSIVSGQFRPNVCFNAKTGDLITRSAEFNSNGSGFVGCYVDDNKLHKGLQWGNNSIKLGNNLKITNDGFIASDNLDNPTSYFKLGSYTGNAGEYVEFKDSNGGGFKSSSCDGYALAVYGPGSYPTAGYCHRSALFVNKGTGNNTAIGTKGNVIVEGILKADGYNGVIFSTSFNTASYNVITDYEHAAALPNRYLQLINQSSGVATISGLKNSKTVKIAAYSTIILYSDGTDWTYEFDILPLA